VISYVDAGLGAAAIGGGLQRMGVTGDAYVMLEPEDGQRIEHALRLHAKFSDMPLPRGGIVRTFTHNGVRFCWEK